MHFETVELYTYCSLGLLALAVVDHYRLMGTSKSFKSGVHCLVGLQTSIKWRFKNTASSRLPLGTIYWGQECELPSEITKSPSFKKALGGLLSIMNIWPSLVKKKKSS